MLKAMVNLKKITYIILIIIFICSGIIIYYSSFEEFKIKGVIKGAKKAVEHQDIDKLMSYVSLQYADDYGFNYPMVKRLISDLFKDFKEFEVIMETPVIKVEDDTATVSLNLLVSVDWNGHPAYIVGTNDSAASVHAYLQKGLLSWKVIKIDGVR